ncbi:serine/threonine protein kinase, partial [Streptomyces sp. SID2131]|nr:serine/threonine protein kinase [Streptomyces sp. SID2131]
EPRPPREPRRRSANPVRIPGLGCLKGCLVMIVLFVVAGWLVWELTPLQSWIAEGKGYWEAIGDGVSSFTGWVSDLFDSANSGTGTGATGGTGQ